MHKAIPSLTILLLFLLAGTMAGAIPDRQQAPPTIISFSTDLAQITVDAAEAGDTMMTLAWHTVGMNQNHRLTVEVYILGGWVTALPQAGAEAGLSPVGARRAVVTHPIDFGPPTYRLVIKNAAGDILDQQILTIPYAQAAAGGPVIAPEGGSPRIALFSSEIESVSLMDLRQNPVPVTVSWRVVNRTPSSHLVFEQMLDGAAVSVEQTRTSLWVPSEGEGMVTLFPPEAPDEHITLRLRLLDIIDDNTLDETTLTIALQADAPNLIQVFDSSLDSVPADDLLGGEARLPVVWEVVERPPNSNLIFEQILPDGSSRSVELPREVEIVPSSGEGVVAPSLPPGAESITLRLRVVDLESGAVLDEQTHTLAVDYTAEDQDQDQAQAQGLSVLAFAASAERYAPGDTVMLGWEVRGADEVSIAIQTPNGSYTDILTEQPATGEASYTLPADFTGTLAFQLAATNVEGGLAQAGATIQVGGSVLDPDDCSYSYFFDPPADEAACPAGFETFVDGAFQAFEGGYMLWHADTNDIYVLIDDSQQLGRYRNTWAEGEPLAIEETPPDGMVAPVRGFGKVWAENRTVREALGWATAPEEAYQIKLQRSAAPDTPRTYLTWPDGQVIYIMGNTWGFVN